MRIFYSLIFISVINLALQAQSSLGAASSGGSFFITDTSCEDLNPHDGVIWPCNIETINCDVLSDPSITGEPIINGDGRDQIKVTYEDILYPDGPPGCDKIYRKWTVTDTGLFKKTEGSGSWEYLQEIQVLKSNPPVFLSEKEDREFCIYKFDCNPGLINLKASATDDCTPELQISYSYEIDLDNNGNVDYTGNTNEISDIFPFGKHKITWFAKDGCGNTSHSEYFFKIKDCQPPVSNCINGRMVDLLPGKGEVTIRAEDFDQGSFDNCELEEFRVVSPSKGDGQTIPPLADSKSLTFDCNSKGVNSVDLWVKDISGNWNYCTTYVIVQDNHSNCGEEVDEEAPLGQKIGQFVEAVPLEIEKIIVPDNEIVQSEQPGLKLLPSQPNPFESATKICFDLEEAAKLTFTIRDISGNVIKIIEKEFSAGYNQITVEKEDFDNAGIFFFTLQSKTHKATGKIVLIQR